MPKCNIKNVANKVIQNNFIKAVSDVIAAENATVSAKQALVNVTLELIGSASTLTYDDRMFIKDMLVLGYQAKYTDDAIALDRATTQFSKIRKVLESEHDIVFLDKETKTAVNKAKSRGANVKREAQQIERVTQISVANDVETAEAVAMLSSNIVESGGSALSESAQKSLVKKAEDQKFNIPAKRELLKAIKKELTFDKDHQQELKELDIKMLQKIVKLLKS
jgi:hypothetical protein